MRFLRTIQKRQSEVAERSEEILEVEPISPGPPRRSNDPAGVLSLPELRIGAPRLEPVTVGGTEPRATGLAGHPPELTPVDREALQDSPVQQEVTVNPLRVNSRLVAIREPRSYYCEEYRNLRTQILHKSRDKRLQAIVVTSAGPLEGKSVTTLNLSWLFAQADGVRVLVIDSDLRKPSLASYLGIETSSGGLSEVLTGGARLMESVVKLQPSGLYVLPGGDARDDVAELISGPKFAEILKEARAIFDYILIDAPPLGIFTDASLLVNQSDGALMVVRANSTRYKDLDRVLDTLPRERLIGVVLNQSDAPLMDESYYQYSAYSADGVEGAIAEQ
jgi:capsular exopolysaccharide synthesis family protein